MTPPEGTQILAMAAIDPFTLIILLFIALPILQGVFGKKQREEQRRRMEQQRRTQQRPSAAGSQNRERRPESAADLVPDDLWELLTGERRQSTRDPVPTRDWGTPTEDVPTPSGPVATEPEPPWQTIPEPAPYEPVSGTDEESDRPFRVSDESTRPTPRREWSDALPEAVSLEQPVRYDDAEERAFHEELAHLPPAARAHRRRPLPYGLGQENEVRRAFILTEILGPPKGLR